MSKVRYSTNWMGPVSTQWYTDRGLDMNKEPYSAGRLDFWNPNNQSIYSDEMAVPPMRREDWNSFSEWLETFESDGVLSLNEIAAEYEKTNPPIRWWTIELENQDTVCKDHPDAPHGFVRNASITEDRYVCECEYWEPPTEKEKQ